jgi:hypothetical protein
MTKGLTARLELAAWILAGLLGADALRAAQPDAAKPLDQIIVIGSKPIDAKVLEKAATPFIRSHAAPGRISGQVARWKKPVCPQTRGLSPAFNQFVTARVRKVAQSVGAPVDQSDLCKPNVEIIFTTEPQKLLDNVAQDHETLLGFHWYAQLKKLATFDRPIQAWYVTATTDKSGAETIDDQREILDGHSPSAGLDNPLLGGTMSAIVNVLIVADTNKVVGYTIGSISDYIAVLAISQAKSLDACSELPSIFDLMADCGGDKPEEISAVDSAYLRALYRMNMRDPPFFQRTELNIHMIKELEGR